MMQVQKLRLLRVLVAINLIVFVAVIVDSILHTKASDEALTTYRILMFAVAGTGLIAYAAGIAGLWFDTLWGRIAFCVFLVLNIVLDEPGDTMRLTLILNDLHTLSSGLVIGVAFFGMPDERGRAVGDVFS